MVLKLETTGFEKWKGCISFLIWPEWFVMTD